MFSTASSAFCWILRNSVSALKRLSNSFRTFSCMGSAISVQQLAGTKKNLVCTVWFLSQMLATKFNYSVNRPIKLWTQLIESKIGAEGFSFFSGCLFSLKVVTNYSTTVDGTERRFKKGAFPERMIIRPVYWCSMSEEGRADLNRTVKSGHSPPGEERKRKLFLSINRTVKVGLNSENRQDSCRNFNQTIKCGHHCYSILKMKEGGLGRWSSSCCYLNGLSGALTESLRAAFIGYAVKLALLSLEKVNMPQFNLGALV